MPRSADTSDESENYSDTSDDNEDQDQGADMDEFFKAGSDSYLLGLKARKSGISQKDAAMCWCNMNESCRYASRQVNHRLEEVRHFTHSAFLSCQEAKGSIDVAGETAELARKYSPKCMMYGRHCFHAAIMKDHTAAESAKRKAKKYKFKTEKACLSAEKFKSKAIENIDHAKANIQAMRYRINFDNVGSCLGLISKKKEGINFMELCKRYIGDIKPNCIRTWNAHFKSLKSYADLAPVVDDSSKVKDLLSQVVVLKLNGLKSVPFLDEICKEIEILNLKYGCDVPIVLMNSFLTHSRTQQIIKNYSNVQIQTFEQSKYPRLLVDDYTPMPLLLGNHDEDDGWYPPGHGDVFQSLKNSGTLASLLSQGKKYVFISNNDNFGATLDLNILNHLVQNKNEFCMELTTKTLSDNGGILGSYEGKLKLMEISQFSPDQLREWKSFQNFPHFNTNNLWVDLNAIHLYVVGEKLKMDILTSVKKIGQREVLELKTAAGDAIRFFHDCLGITVPRSRYRPVKSIKDIRSKVGKLD